MLPVALEPKWFCITVLSFAIKQKKDEPLANVEIVTDSQGEQSIRNCLHQFIMD